MAEITTAELIATAEANLAALKAQQVAWDTERAKEVMADAAVALAACPVCDAAGIALVEDADRRDEAWVILDLAGVGASTPLEREGARLLCDEIARRWNGKDVTETSVRISVGKLRSNVPDPDGGEGATKVVLDPRSPLAWLEERLA